MSDSICNQHAPTPHNEAICHATGEKRKNIVDKLKKLLDEVDNRPCSLSHVLDHDKLIKDVQKSPVRTYAQKSPGRQTVEKCCIEDEINHHNHHHPTFYMRKAIDRGLPIFIKPAVITKYSTTGDNCENVNKGINKFANNYQMQMPAQEKFSSKKQAQQGEEEGFYNCSCLRANGLQDQCPLPDCQGREECIAVNPGPCCKPALTLLCEMQQEKLQRAAAAAAAANVAHHEGRFQNMNQEDRNLNTYYGDSPKTLECFCYYE